MPDAIDELVDWQLGLDKGARHDCRICYYWSHRPFAECPDCGWRPPTGR